MSIHRLFDRSHPAASALGRYLNVLLFLAILVGGLPCGSAEAKKIGYKLKTVQSKEDREEEMTAGTFMVASECPTCNNGYTLDQLSFSGYDKNQNSDKETFFITNNTDRTLRSITLYIEYLTPDGRQLHKKFLKLSCNIPPGETRIAEIKSWDSNHAFYYRDSRQSRGGGSPFIVRFDPVAYYLSF